jgi:hypothetical protein
MVQRFCELVLEMTDSRRSSLQGANFECVSCVDSHGLPLQAIPAVTLALAIG